MKKFRLVSDNRGRLTRVISVTSGKGGVGKTHTTVNLGTALAQLGRRVLIVDADIGLANANIMLGVEPVYTLVDFLEGRCRIEDLLISAAPGLSLIPAASGVSSSAVRLAAEQKVILRNALESVAGEFDYLLIDTQAGIGEEALFFTAASSEVLVVVTPEPTSIADAYAVIKLLSLRYQEREATVLVNSVPLTQWHRGGDTFERLASVAEQYLGMKLNHLGSVPIDGVASECVSRRMPLVKAYPGSIGGRALIRLARQLDRNPPSYRVKGGVQLFFDQILERSA